MLQFDLPAAATDFEDMERKLIRICIEDVTKGYAPISDYKQSVMLLTTPQLIASIKGFCGLQLSEAVIYDQMTARKFKHAFIVSEILGIKPNFYWIFGEK